MSFIKGLVLFMLFTLSACSGTKGLLKSIGGGSDNSIKAIALESSINSNMDTPVAIDLLFIKDESIGPLLLALNGPLWFKDKSALLKRYEKSIDIVSLEVVPLTLIDKVELPKNHTSAKSILMFANYRNISGQFVADISQFKHLKIRLLLDSYELVEVGK